MFGVLVLLSCPMKSSFHSGSEISVAHTHRGQSTRRRRERTFFLRGLRVRTIRQYDGYYYSRKLSAYPSWLCSATPQLGVPFARPRSTASCSLLASPFAGLSAQGAPFVLRLVLLRLHK